MPAAAVIPAPIAYIKVVAVKKLVVELMTVRKRGLGQFACRHPSASPTRPLLVGWRSRHFTLKKLECFRQAMARIH